MGGKERGKEEGLQPGFLRGCLPSRRQQGREPFPLKEMANQRDLTTLSQWFHRGGRTGRAGPGTTFLIPGENHFPAFFKILTKNRDDFYGQKKKFSVKGKAHL